MLAELDTRTLVDRVYQILREQILSGNYKPGQKLNIDRLTRKLGVSNTPIRGAIARLEQVGLVETVPYRGPKVKRISIAQLKDLYEVRLALEELAVKLVAEQNDPDALHDIAAALEVYESAADGNDTRAIVKADRAFHDALVKASGNRMLLEMLPDLSDRTQFLMELKRPPSEVYDDAVLSIGRRGHRRIYESLQDGDQDAAIRELRQHLILSKEQLLERMVERNTLDQY